MNRIITLLCTILLSGSLNAQIPTNGLIAWYPFNGNANDESGNGNNGTVNGATLTRDRFGIANNAYSFDGLNDFIFIPSSNSLDINSDLTISAWVKFSSVNDSGIILWRGDDANSQNPYFLFKDNNTIGFRRDIDDGNTIVNAIAPYTTIDTVNYIFIVGRYQSSSGLMEIIINDSMISGELATYPITYSTSSMWNMIGSVDLGTQYFFNGKIDDIRIYNRALTQTEITALYNESPCAEIIGAAISGKVTYDNAPLDTPISCSKIYLKTTGGTIIDSTTTDLNGDYRFCGVQDGSYKVVPQTAKIPGGINSTDALLAVKHLVEIITLTGIRYLAGDVNGGGYINSTDALVITKRYTQLIPTFSIGDWIFDNPTITISGISAKVIDIKGLCVGDLNGSYIPPVCNVQPCPGLPTFFYGGQTYNTVQIGNQCWMKENLNIGTMIYGWQNQSNNGIIQKYCIFNSYNYCSIYGGLYQWNEMMNYSLTPGSQGICSVGWHIPTLADWDTLVIFLGGVSVAGGKMKETGFTHWNSPNTGATNESGFSALGAGYRDTDGNFYDSRHNTFFHSSLQSNLGSSEHQFLRYDNSALYQSGGGNTMGYSLRCIKD